jgi:hypothetical protein
MSSSDGSSGSSASGSSGSEDEEQQHVHQVVTGANADPQVLQYFWDLASLQQVRFDPELPVSASVTADQAAACLRQAIGSSFWFLLCAGFNNCWLLQGLCLLCLPTALLIHRRSARLLQKPWSPPW